MAAAPIASTQPPDRRPAEWPEGRDDGAWLILAITGLLIALLQWIDPFTLSLRSLAGPVGFALLLGALACYYHVLRPVPAIRAMLTGLALMLLFSAIGASLSYMIAARGGPLWDDQLARWDGAIGLDWLSWMHWLDAHPLLATLLNLAYRTLIPQMIALILLLGFCHQLAALRIVMQAAMLAGLCVILLSGLLPAIGTYTHFGLSPSDYPNLRPAAPYLHIADLNGLRDGSFRALTLDRLQGIITFPSYHGALAMVFGWGFSRATIRAVRWIGTTLALLTLIATPVDGGHYFSDVIAGALIAAASLWIACRTVHWTIRPRFHRKGLSGTLSPA
ncbi:MULTISPECIES: phosphatase PAP2 family protein [Sphingobium]|jgi:membrane-associated phospholipid phosphatase|uniref:phosphatase PAP2 family protein n=1 Tax=Sphingobium TaxID=165695 RepID=UPI0024320586|nr:phosphatase PAP2 family protein [Sphingobium yanoikuyae]